MIPEAVYQFALKRPRIFGGLWYASFAALAFFTGTALANFEEASYTLSNYIVGAFWCGLFAFLWSLIVTRSSVLCEPEPYLYRSIISGIAIPLLTYFSIYFLYPVIVGFATGVISSDEMDFINTMLISTVISMLAGSYLIIPFGLAASITLRIFACRNPFLTHRTP